jgi:hypothetical protein
MDRPCSDAVPRAITFAFKFSMRKHGSDNGSLARVDYEVMITYPFHPLVGQSVLVVGDKEHGGTRYLIICNSDGAKLPLDERERRP